MGSDVVVVVFLVGVGDLGTLNAGGGGTRAGGGGADGGGGAGGAGDDICARFYLYVCWQCLFLMTLCAHFFFCVLIRQTTPIPNTKTTNTTLPKCHFSCIDGMRIVLFPH